MIDILVFLIVIFGIFCVFINQYISLYREIYFLWLDEIVFTDFYTQDISTYASNKCSICPLKSEQNYSCSKISCSFKISSSNICSKIESYARGICTYIEIIMILVYLICIISSFTSVFLFISIFYNIADSTQPNSLISYIFVEILIIIIFISIIYLLKKVGIDILHPNQTDKIDEKLFEIWCKYDCHFSKNLVFQQNLKPKGMYEILAEKIHEYNIKDIDTENDKIITNIIKEGKSRRQSMMKRKSDKLIDLMRDNKDFKKIIEEGNNK